MNEINGEFIYKKTQIIAKKGKKNGSCGMIII